MEVAAAAPPPPAAARPSHQQQQAGNSHSPRLLGAGITNALKKEQVMNIREAKEEDFPGIIELCDGVFDGFDVFPWIFTRFITAPNRLVHVALNERGRMVACTASVVLDDGKIFQGEGARTLKQYEGTAIQHKLRKANYTEMKRRFPNIRPVVRVASVHTGFYDSRQKDTVKLHYTEHLVSFADPIDPRTISTLTSRDNWNLPIGAIQDISPEDFKMNILQNKETCELLFPQGILWLHSEIYELLESNIQGIYFGRGEAKIAASYDSTRGRYESLSAALSLQCAKGFACDIADFGVDDVDVIKAHIIKQLCLLPPTGDLSFYITLGLQKGLISDNTVKTLIEFWKSTFHVVSDPCIQNQYILDIKLSPQYSSNL